MLSTETLTAEPALMFRPENFPALIASFRNIYIVLGDCERNTHKYTHRHTHSFDKGEAKTAQLPLFLHPPPRWPPVANAGSIFNAAPLRFVLLVFY